MVSLGHSLHNLRSENDIGREGLGKKPSVLLFTLTLCRRKSMGFGAIQTCVQLLALSLTNGIT